jgi:PadR family transcriptional regulator, regulatory protein PadR
MSAEPLKGHLDLLILAALDSKPMHGYAVIEAIRERSCQIFDLAEGSIYPALHRLEHDGLLASSWSRVNGRRRRTYRLTRVGRAALRRQAAQWTEFSHAVSAVLGIA